MKYLIRIFLCTLPLCLANFEPRKLIDTINAQNSTWVAGLNFPENTSIETLHRLNGVRGIHPDSSYKLEVKRHPISRDLIPENFDAREQWSYCNEIVNNVRNQGACGSCWAFASTEVMSDRLCIQTNGSVKFEFSPEDLVTCCDECGDCGGGYVSYAFMYWIQQGVVSGGDYGSNRGCKPYSASSFSSGIKKSCNNVTCDNNSYATSYTNDKRFGNTVYSIPNDQQQIQTEILNNGPVGAIYTVYQDFFLYQNGVYQPVDETVAGTHAVKIVGWGTENETPYWLVANSWGAEWGKLDGFFKILRGSNVCGIEENVFAGGASSSTFILASKFLTILCVYFIYKYCY